MVQKFDRFPLWIGHLAVLSVLPAAAMASPTSTIAHLPNVQIHAAKVDPAGNIFLAGQANGSASTVAAYIAKLAPDGTVLYTVTIGGSSSGATVATVLDIDSAGAVYVAGTTTASDFPVTAGAVQSPVATGFAAKLDAKGNIVYAALIGSANAQPLSVAVNSSGELLVSGQLLAAPPPAAPVGVFLLKLSADGTAAVNGPQNVGGLLAVDAQDNVYVAGAPPGGSNEPAATPGAFQGNPVPSYCSCPFLSFPCGGDQFVASLTPDLSRTRFLTYLTARYGAFPASMAVDSQGNVLVAGTTIAPAYPTTSGCLQPDYTASTETVLTCGPPIPMEITSPSGYVTLVEASGSGLIFSTFFSGSKTDRITFAALTSSGIYLAGQAGSADLPGFDGAVPSQCLPASFVTRMTLDGAAITSSRTPPGTPLTYDSTSGTLLLISGSDLLRFDPSQPTPIACVVDAVDLSPVTAVAPGELLTLFGRFLYLETDPFAVPMSPVNGYLPTNSEGLGIAASRTPAPLLYVSQPQINFQVPYEVAGSAQTSLTLTYPDVNGKTASDSRTLQVAASNPVAFLSQPSIAGQAFLLAFNADGTVNSQSNPASAGSDVTIFLDGLGVTSPPPVTGLINPSPSVALNLPLTVTPACNGTFCYPAPAVVSAGSLAGAVSGVNEVQLSAPANPNGASEFQSIFSLSVGQVAVRDTNLSFWVK